MCQLSLRINELQVYTYLILNWYFIKQIGRLYATFGKCINYTLFSKKHNFKGMLDSVSGSFDRALPMHSVDRDLIPVAKDVSR